MRYDCIFEAIESSGTPGRIGSDTCHSYTSPWQGFMKERLIFVHDHEPHEYESLSVIARFHGASSTYAAGPGPCPGPGPGRGPGQAPPHAPGLGPDPDAVRPGLGPGKS